MSVSLSVCPGRRTHSGVPAEELAWKSFFRGHLPRARPQYRLLALLRAEKGQDGVGGAERGGALQPAGGVLVDP